MPMPHLSPERRVTVAIAIAVLVHAVVILGVSFNVDLNKPPHADSLEVTLVHSRSERPPETADFLAQAQQRGGGNVKEQARPATPLANQRHVQEEGRAPATRLPSAPAAPPSPSQPLLSSSRPQATQAPVQPPQPESPPQPTAAELVKRSMEIARLSAEIRQNQQSFAQQPRHEYVTSNTRELITAAYEDAWREKIERIGNLNYPEEAKRRNLSGMLLLDVAIRPDGSLESVRVLRSSGEAVLDDGAIRIVRLAAPYAPFSDELRRRVDVLHIIRVWRFSSENRLTANQ